jgi:hypothetical membrane protein
VGLGIASASPYLDLRRLGLLCLACPVWFIGLYALFSSFNHDFHHLGEPISGLGALGEWGAGAWNLLGFIVPGIVVAALGSSMKRAMPEAPIANLAGSSLIISGIFLAGAGVFPTAPSGDPVLLNRIHEFAGWGSFAAFLVAGISSPWVVWHRTHSRALFLTPLCLVIGTALSFGLFRPDLWWLSQRVGVLCYFLWIGVMGLVTLRLSKQPGTQERPVAPAGGELLSSAAAPRS